MNSITVLCSHFMNFLKLNAINLNMMFKETNSIHLNFRKFFKTLWGLLLFQRRAMMVK